MLVEGQAVWMSFPGVVFTWATPQLTLSSQDVILCTNWDPHSVVGIGQEDSLLINGPIHSFQGHCVPFCS